MDIIYLLHCYTPTQSKQILSIYQLAMKLLIAFSGDSVSTAHLSETQFYQSHISLPSDLITMINLQIFSFL